MAVSRETNGKNKNIRDLYRGTNDFEKGYQPRTNTVKVEKGDLVTDCHSVLARWRDHFSQLLNVHGVSDVRHTEVHTAEPMMSETSAFEFKMANEKLKRCKLPDIDQIPAEMIKAGGRTIQSEIHKLTSSVWIKEELPEQWKEFIIVPLYKRDDKTGCRHYRGMSLLSASYKILTSILLSRLTIYSEEITGDHQCGFQHNR